LAILNPVSNWIISGNLAALSIVEVGNATTYGSFIITKTSATSVRVFRRGNLATTLTVGGSVSPSQGPLYVGAVNSTNLPGADAYSPRELAFVFGGKGLTNAEVSNISTYINTFQTSLGRNVY
jgi:hypothetical protein